MVRSAGGTGSFRTCTEHRGEEVQIQRIDEELADVAGAEEAYLEERELGVDPHADEAGKFEEAIRRFMVSGSPQRLESGKGFRTDPGLRKGRRQRRQLDIVIDVGSGHLGWRYGQRQQVLRDPPLAHLEVCYRAKPDWRKLREDLARVHESARTALTTHRRKCWTATILLGPGWSHCKSNLPAEVHEYFHGDGRRPTRQEAQGERFTWDYPDVVVGPGLCLKKQDCLPVPGATLERIPGYLCIAPSPSDPCSLLRPLAAARAYLRYFLKVAAAGVLAEGNVASQEELSAIVGPRPELPIRMPWLALDHANRDAVFSLSNDGGHVAFRRLTSTCTAGRAYIYEATVPVRVSHIPRC